MEDLEGDQGRFGKILNQQDPKEVFISAGNEQYRRKAKDAKSRV